MNKLSIMAWLLALLLVFSAVGCAHNRGVDGMLDRPVIPLTLAVEELAESALLYEDTAVEQYNNTLRLTANVDLTQVQFVSLHTDTSLPDEVLYSQPALAKGESLYIRTYVNDAVPTRGVVCTDAEGQIYHFAFAYAGQDGTVYLDLLENVE